MVPTCEIVVISDAFPGEDSVAALPDAWSDSPEVIALTEPLYASMRTDDIPALLDRVVLFMNTNEGARWTVSYMCFEFKRQRVDFCFQVDSADGHVRIQEGR